MMIRPTKATGLGVRFEAERKANGTEMMKAPSASPRISVQLTILALSIAALAMATSLNLLIDAGALVHDITCPTHGWVS